jgi:hypothetical protein
MQVELPLVVVDPLGRKIQKQKQQHPLGKAKPPQQKQPQPLVKFVRRGRKFSIKKSGSLQSITEEILGRSDLEQHGLVKFNIPNAAGKIPLPILSMESDTPGISLQQHKAVALWVGKLLHKKFHCQVQVVWSGNKSYHVHFRLNRVDVVRAEAIALQTFLTERMEKLVRKKFSLPSFSFDRRVMGRLELVRLGGGTRVEIGGKATRVKQKIVKHYDSDFSNAATIFPMSAALKKSIAIPAASKARSRARKKVGPYGRPRKKWLSRYAEFLAAVKSTVRPSHWGYRGENREPVMICYYGPRDKNPSCVLARDSYFVTDSRGKKHPVVYTYKDFRQARRNDLRSVQHEESGKDSQAHAEKNN